MTNKTGWMFLLALVGVFAFSGMATAELIIIGRAEYDSAPDTGINTSLSHSKNIYNLIYDSGPGLVWLDYTRGYDSWQDQVNWASTLGGYLTVKLDPHYTTDINWKTGWRLPETDESKDNLKGPWPTTVGDGTGFGWGGPDKTGHYDYYKGYNLVNSEMGQLFYKSLGNKGYYAKDGTNPQPGWGFTNTDDFENLLTVDPDLLWAVKYYSGTEYSLNSNDAWGFNFLDGKQSPADKSAVNNYYALAVIEGKVSPVPEPATMLLLASGLLGLAGLRRKFRKA
jgi:hypothetical protein